MASLPRVTRRQFLTAMAAGAVLARDMARPAAAIAAEPLKVLAQRSDRFWGAAIQTQQIQPESDFSRLLVRECDVIVPEWEMKWGAVESHQGRPNFAKADILARFAVKHGLRVRGHALVWHRNIPDWVKELIKGPSDWTVVATHIATMLKRYGGAPFIQWDVLNEVIEPKDRRDDGLRDSPFLRAFGPDYIPKALTTAHEQAPHMQLYINEYGVDYDAPVNRMRRTALLRLLESIKRSGTPLHGVGIQAHLRAPGVPFSDNALRDFLKEIAGLGLKITITELDVQELDVSRPEALRDETVAAEVRRYLDVVLDEPAVVGVVTWGLSNRYSWLNSAKLRKDGAINRGLPFDDKLAGTLVTNAISEVLARHARR